MHRMMAYIWAPIPSKVLCIQWMFTGKNKDKDNKDDMEPVLCILLSCIHSKTQQYNYGMYNCHSQN